MLQGNIVFNEGKFAVGEIKYIRILKSMDLKFEHIFSKFL